MEYTDKVSLLQDFIDTSDKCELVCSGVIKLTNELLEEKNVGINLIALIEMLCENNIDVEYIDRLILNNNELKDLN